MAETVPLRLATRGSPLARWQALRVQSLLSEVGVPSELVVVDTEGDRRSDLPLGALGGAGVFVKEIQYALLRGEADLAVHSAKDLPASSTVAVKGLTLAAVPERGDSSDVLVGATLESLSPGAIVATGSPRRRVQLAAVRPDLGFVELRGNLATRLAQVGVDGVTAVITAKAALDRLEWQASPGLEFEILSPDVMVPQVGQGALAVECRSDDVATRAAVAAIDRPAQRRLVEAERAFLATLGGGCTMPVGAWARYVEPGSPQLPSASTVIELLAMLADEDRGVVVRKSAQGTDGDSVGQSLAEALLEDVPLAAPEHS